MSSLGERNCSGEAGATHCGGVEAFQPQEAVRNSHTAPATWPPRVPRANEHEEAGDLRAVAAHLGALAPVNHVSLVLFLPWSPHLTAPPIEIGVPISAVQTDPYCVGNSTAPSEICSRTRSGKACLNHRSPKEHSSCIFQATPPPSERGQRTIAPRQLIRSLILDDLFGRVT